MKNCLVAKPSKEMSQMLAKLEVYFDGEYWCARGIGADVFTQGRTVDELMGNIREAAALHF